ncbi:MAG: hypothetical protein KatS3mg013_0603 [Actinomycetota bacterium]|jgi:formiminotetrahydrofolate cyclodeaminase|nr:MAG: hypothetical protein KatS3mg013_0603 [Actinomycetota bacterium]
MRAPSTAERTIGDWLEILASDAPTPGGGGASALLAATGAGLLAMVGRLTLGRNRFADVEDRMRSLLDAADRARAEFLRLADRDAEAFDRVMTAYRLPRDQGDARDLAIQQALGEAASVPLELAQRAAQTLALAEDATALGNPQAASDGYCAAVALHGAVLGALANVRINAVALRDEDRRRELLLAIEEVRERADRLLESASAAFDRRLGPSGP